MADPATILAIVNGSAGLALKIGAIVNNLYTLSQNLKHAELTIQSIASECQTIQTAWDAIKAWVSAQPVDTLHEQQPVLDRLRQSLVFGTMVLRALEDDLVPFIFAPQRSLGLFGRSKVLWNEATFSRHQDRIRGQVAAMTLLIQVITLPSTTERTELLVREEEILRQSDETAWTIVDSSASISVRHPDQRDSMESSDTISVTFDFEPELLTGRVYGRSYKYLAKKVLRIGGKQPSQDVQANLMIEEMENGKDSDEISVLPVFRHRRQSNRSVYTELVYVTTKNGQTCDCCAKFDNSTSGNFVSIIQLRRLGFDEEDLTPIQHTPPFRNLGSIELIWARNNREGPEGPFQFYVLEDTFKDLILGKDFSFQNAAAENMIYAAVSPFQGTNKGIYQDAQVSEFLPEDDSQKREAGKFEIDDDLDIPPPLCDIFDAEERRSHRERRYNYQQRSKSWPIGADWVRAQVNFTGFRAHQLGGDPSNFDYGRAHRIGNEQIEGLHHRLDFG